MRFLLNKVSAAASNSRKHLLSQPIITSIIETTPFFTDDTVSNTETKETVQTWGQQCSPNCGCALRFKADINPENQNRIEIMTYHAKTVITTASKSADGKTILQPLLTQSGGVGGKGRPMLKECSCKTLHVLAKSITDILPTLTLSQAQNQLEFSGVRSSTAFRYSVLKNNNLLREEEDRAMHSVLDHVHEGHCFDLVEEALVACLKGYTPRPRLTNVQRIDVIQYPKSLPQEIVEKSQSPRNDVNPLRFVQAAKKRAKNSPNLPSEPLQYEHHHDNFPQTTSMPPFHFMNESDYISNEFMKSESAHRPRHDRNDGGVSDWVSYVDEAHRIQQL